MYEPYDHLALLEQAVIWKDSDGYYRELSEMDPDRREHLLAHLRERADEIFAVVCARTLIQQLKESSLGMPHRSGEPHRYLKRFAGDGPAAAAAWIEDRPLVGALRALCPDAVT
jgi:hypothetical protein